jgi:tetratricopeptide (TPR) repeat protein
MPAVITSKLNPVKTKVPWGSVWGGCAIVLVGCVAYAHSFSGPFVFDDHSAVTHNLTIRQLWPIGPVLHPPANGSPVTGRPVANLSLAINYAVSGQRVLGYHAFNFLVHVLAGLTLFGIVRRTLATGSKRRLPWSASLQKLPPISIALAVAAVWTAHPLQTESVTYISGRTESLMGLLYLLTLYCFIRATDCPEAEAGARRPRPTMWTQLWSGLAIAACLVGMAVKEVMATAPLMVLLYDRTFIAGNFRDAWRGRRNFYLILASTWLLLAWLVADAGGRGGTAGFDTDVPWWRYAEVQGAAILHYVRLAFWPHPLVVDYGYDFGGSRSVLVAEGLIVVALLAATVLALWRKPLPGFIGAWFFVILAPSSSVIPVATELVAERRMYLPLAALCVLAVVGVYHLLGRKSTVVLIGVTIGLALLTIRRNDDYRSDEALWRATVQAIPGNAGAHNNLGGVLLKAGNLQAAIMEFKTTLTLNPLLPGAHNNLGMALAQDHQWAAARAQYEEALQLVPIYDAARRNLAALFLQLEMWPEAIAQYQEVLRLQPGEAKAHHLLALALDRAGRLSESAAEYEQALRIDPRAAVVHYDLGNLLVRNRRLPEAIEQFKEAIRLDPDYAEAIANLGGALLETGQLLEAMAQYQSALQYKPDLVEARINLGSVLLRLGRPEDAIASYRAALRLSPDSSTAHHNFGVALRSIGRLEEAAAQFEMASRLKEGR